MEEAGKHEEPGSKCTLLGKRVSELTHESHARLLSSTTTATVKVLARSIDKMRRGSGNGHMHSDAEDEAAVEDRVGELMKKGRDNLIVEYVEMMHSQAWQA